MNKRNLSEIAQEIKRDWKPVNYAARPYLWAMSGFSTVDDTFGFDSARSVVLYFLSNASSWRGEVAKRVKAELKAHLKGGSK